MPDRDKIPYETTLSSMLLSIVKQAQADGIITADEGELINRIQIDVRDYEIAAADALREGKSSQKEIFMASKDTIIKNATEIARKDGIITEEEEAIINKLIKELENIDSQ